jgi:hypothetical protein
VIDCRNIIDDSVAANRFSGTALANAIAPVLLDDRSVGPALKQTADVLEAKTFRHTLMGMTRAIFLIEPVNDAVTSTKFEARWSSRLNGDPRECSFEECCSIFADLAEDLHAHVAIPEIQSLLDRFCRFTALPYETPIDYISRESDGPLHFRGNLRWLWDDTEIEHTLLLRECARDPSLVDDLANAFRLASDKIKVKTYLTDRALTGDTKTNREKRWEAHPESVQFAFRRDCLKIEHKLLSQVCSFAGFPEEIRSRLVAAQAIINFEIPARCPITRDPLDFDVLVASLESPEWGRSAFQVGHLNPLKGPGSGSEFGHTPANVAWITADGNRIQGHLSYEETMQLLERIRINYQT